MRDFKSYIQIEFILTYILVFLFAILFFKKTFEQDIEQLFVDDSRRLQF